MKTNFALVLLLASFIVKGQEANFCVESVGTAPFAVFFDAIDASGVIQPQEIDGRKEYADLHYSWDFGDPGKGNWPESNKSKNHEIGYVATYIYDDPGTYTVTLTVKNLEGESHTYTQEIIVQDPDVVT